VSSEETVKGEGFEILGRDAPGAESGEAAGAAAEGVTGAETSEEAAQQYQVNVQKVIQVFVTELGQVAWQKMGLQANPFTNRVEKDIEQARLAIDACGALAERLLPHLAAQEARSLQVLLTDLRLNFVRQAEATQ
jgi:hypothetical protein